MNIEFFWVSKQGGVSAVAQAAHSWRANRVVAGGLRVICRVDTEGNNSGVTSIANFLKNSGTLYIHTRGHIIKAPMLHSTWSSMQQELKRKRKYLKSLNNCFEKRIFVIKLNYAIVKLSILWHKQHLSRDNVLIKKWMDEY